MRGRGVSALAFLVYAAVTATVVVSQEAPVQQEAVQREAATTSAVTIAATEAPAGFDGGSNGFLSDRTSPTFEEAREEFIGPEGPEEGLGPVFNAAGCGDCHSVPIIGGSSQIVERRAGRWDGQRFTDHPGGSLIHDQSLSFPGVGSLQETVLSGHNVIALRASLSVLGLGFVEAVDSNDLVELANDQPSSLRGQVIQIPVLEAPGSNRVGRFGWKNQHASLLSFSGDAYANEMGISTPLFPFENTVNGQPLPPGTDPFPEANGMTDDDNNEDLDLFAAFMRSNKVPPRDTALAATFDARRGEQLFTSIGCATCHTPTMVTAPRGTRINGGTFAVPDALGSKIIHPFSDFLLHDIGTGDGIVQNGGGSTRNKLRTVPLWGLRVRGRFMHDGLSMSVSDAIQRHGGQATGVRSSYNNLSSSDRSRVLLFLRSL
jgi:CxxC motif-containing protein (DUF1111 family)